jgi:hypothetical protein
MTNNKQQTAVDSIIELCQELLANHYSISHDAVCSEVIKFCQEKAKEMEKKQIAKAFDDGDYNYHYSRKTGDDFEDGTEYFNEVYG